MQKTFLKDVFELLQKIGAVSSESEFSKDWLCRSECYMRTLRFKRFKPSVGMLAICASKLQHYGGCITATEQHTHLGKRFMSSVNSVVTSRLIRMLWDGAKTR